jgi:diguanylate cyclase (GGDEF)-like protein
MLAGLVSLKKVRDSIPALSPNEADQTLLTRLDVVNRLCLGAVSLICLLNLGAAIFPQLACVADRSFHPMAVVPALAGLFSALGLFGRGTRRPQLQHIAAPLALITALLAIAGLALSTLPFPSPLEAIPVNGCPAVRETMSVAAGAAFFLLALSGIFMGARQKVLSRIGDLAVFLLCLLTLALISGYVFGAMDIFGLSANRAPALQILVCLGLLTLATVIRQAESGLFSILLGRGIGGRVARTFIPIFLVAQFLREAARAHLTKSGVLPAHSAAILASAATMVSLSVLIFLAWRINSMETEIHDLSLRDTLTGLYNLRGFTVIAEHALRLARRTRMPFSVLYIDLNDLKQINDTFGHEVGSAFLSETGTLLKETFRNADVIGRIGGDEFAVAGHFSPAAVDMAAERLRTVLARRNRDASRPFPLTLSLGHATATDRGEETLNRLLAAADAAMYEEKRRAKVFAG